MIGLLIIIAFAASNILSIRVTEINYFWEVFFN